MTKSNKRLTTAGSEEQLQLLICFYSAYRHISRTMAVGKKTRVRGATVRAFRNGVPFSSENDPGVDDLAAEQRESGGR